MFIKLIQILMFFFGENIFEEFIINNFFSITDTCKDITQEIVEVENDSKKEVSQKNKKIKILTIIIVFMLICTVCQEPSFGGDDAFFSNL